MEYHATIFYTGKGDNGYKPVGTKHFDAKSDAEAKGKADSFMNIWIQPDEWLLADTPMADIDPPAWWNIVTEKGYMCSLQRVGRS